MVDELTELIVDLSKLKLFEISPNFSGEVSVVHLGMGHHLSSVLGNSLNTNKYRAD